MKNKENNKKGCEHIWILSHEFKEHYQVILSSLFPIPLWGGLTGKWLEVWRCNKCFSPKKIHGE